MNLLPTLRRTYPQFGFVSGPQFSWVPTKQQIKYRTLSQIEDEWSLLHELGHALLDHHAFTTDISLLQMEVAAWEQASRLAPTYNLTIDWRHIEHCLDSYRDWLHARSTCPSCQTVSFQLDGTTYACFNCQTQWKVSKSRLCRPHRRQLKSSPIH